MTTVLLTTATHHLDPPMAMFRGMGTVGMQVTQATQATRVMVTTTTVTWQKRENMPCQEIPISRKVLKRREIETTNPVEISIQVTSQYHNSIKKIL